MIGDLMWLEGVLYLHGVSAEGSQVFAAQSCISAIRKIRILFSTVL